MLKIDMHSHIIPKNLPDWGKEFGYEGFIKLDHHKSSWARMMQGDHFFREINHNCWNPEVRIKEYEMFNTHVQVVSTIPVLFAYFAHPEHGLKVAKFLNNDLSNLVNKYPKKYIGLGTIPMQSTELAVEELHRIKKIGLVGVQIGSNINNKNLHGLAARAREARLARPHRGARGPAGRDAAAGEAAVRARVAGPVPGGRRVARALPAAGAAPRPPHARPAHVLVGLPRAAGHVRPRGVTLPRVYCSRVESRFRQPRWALHAYRTHHRASS